jgi:hypothetical protein
MTRWLGVAVAGWCLLFLLAPLRGADDPAIQRAVEKGVAYLKRSQQPDGRWKHDEIGATALAALTLLECGVPANDPAIQKAAAVIREASIDVTRTYTIATSIMFLDRLGEPVDVSLIQSLSLRLLAGQSGQGGWSYECSGVAPAEAARLRQAVNQRNERGPDKDPPKAGQGRRDFKDLPPEVQQQWNMLNGAGPRGASDDSDNSNTQFAVLALWVGRRQGIPVEKALVRAETRFRATQKPDGGWAYKNNNGGAPANLPILGAQGGGLPLGGSTPSMTCAGLIGLGAGYGVGTETALRTAGANFNLNNLPRNLPDPNNDRQVKAALLLLGTMIDNSNATPANPGPGAGNPPGPPANPGAGAGNPPGAVPPNPEGPVGKPTPPGAGTGNPPGPPGSQLGGRPWVPSALPGAAGAPSRLQWDELGKGYYFLWSLERVGVAYGLETIGDKDWYAWGSQNIVQNQAAEGRWGNTYPLDPVDTCFALLFLQKANLARDLTATLKGRVKDPAVRELKTGAGGVELSKNKPDLKPSVGTDDKGTDSKPSASKEQPGGAGASRAADPEAARLSDELVTTTAGKQDQVLEKLRDSKGTVYTQALADAIPRLAGAIKNKARDALAERLTRMTATTLKDKLEDDEAEIRRAAALACAMKEEKSLIPRLIDLLQDKEPGVMRAAHTALKNLTGEDFGPGEANPAELKRAVDAWKAWWASHKAGK